MEFEKVKEEHILKAIKDYQEKGLPKGFGPSSTYDIFYKDESYPPKAIMAYATRHATGKIMKATFKGGAGTDCFKALEREGFVIKFKKDPLVELVSNYKSYITKSKMQDEVYKWELVNKYKGRPDINVKDFTTEIKSIKFNNLIYSMSIAVINHLAKNKPEELRGLFKKLLNESSLLKERISEFNKGTLSLYRSLGKTLGHHQDERSMATYLTFYNPEKYTLYKSTFYEKFCDLLNIKPLGKNEKYAHYLELLQEFIDKYISIDQGLINQVKGYIPEYYDGKNHLLLAQDILYCMLNKEKSIISLIQDFITQADKGGLKTSSYPKTYQKLKLKVSFGQGVAARIPWIGLYKEPNTIQKGIYPVFLYYKEYHKLVLAYGISETEQVDYNWSNTEKLQSIEEWHLKEFKKKPDRYGSSFIKGIYDVSKGLDEDTLTTDLEELIAVYENIDFSSKSNYWVFQANPKIYDTVRAIEDNVLETWSVHAHKTKIKIGDKVILWITGQKSGCYALAEVTSKLFHSPEISNEKKYYAKDPADDVTSDRVKIKITHDLTKSPVLKTEMKIDSIFDSFKGGNQGTNFSATESEYNAILNWREMKKTQYWLYAPGENARKWEDFYNNGIMGLGWDEIGDLKQYDTRDEIKKALVNAYGGEGSKKNDVSANDDFHKKINIGDIIIAKKGRGELLGYGVVTSNYEYDKNRTDYQKVRKIDWKLKGNWKVNFTLVLKTLTDITKYYSDETKTMTYYDELLNIMNQKIINNTEKMESPINTILYGPPGTGKTYSLKNDYFSKYTISETSVSQEKYFENIVSECTWFQVIAMALIELGKSKVSDIIKNRWVQQKTEMSTAKSIRPIAWGQLQYHTLDSCEFVNLSSKSNITVFSKDIDSFWEISENDAKEQIPEVYELIEKVNNFIPNPDVEIKNYEFITFHQSYSYEDFIEGIKPVMNESETNEDSAIGYQIQDGVFKKLCFKAAKNPSERYAIFIDEINRGNVSAIFGELITLIEQDKRHGEDNEVSLQLPYSKSLFSVPANIDIYGTMNTADRSVEALDTALRRRFSFVEMMPNVSLLESSEIDGISLKDVLMTINDRIEILIDRDHCIGHSYFMNLKTTRDLRLAFKDKIVPLLQEYFYGDYGKIGLVLGEGFVKSHSKSKTPFANFTYEGKEELNRDFFDLIAIDDEFDIKQAIGKLLNKTEDS